MHVHMVHADAQSQRQPRTHTHVHTRTYTDVKMHVHTHMYTHMYMHMYWHPHVHINTYTYTYTCAQTHARTKHTCALIAPQRTVVLQGRMCDVGNVNFVNMPRSLCISVFLRTTLPSQGRQNANNDFGLDGTLERFPQRCCLHVAVSTREYARAPAWPHLATHTHTSPLRLNGSQLFSSWSTV